MGWKSCWKQGHYWGYGGYIRTLGHRKKDGKTLYDLGFRGITPTIVPEMEKGVDKSMETGLIGDCFICLPCDSVLMGKSPSSGCAVQGLEMFSISLSI